MQRKENALLLDYSKQLLTRVPHVQRPTLPTHTTAPPRSFPGVSPCTPSKLTSPGKRVEDVVAGSVGAAVVAEECRDCGVRGMASALREAEVRCMYIDIGIHTYTHTNTNTQTHTHTYIYIYMYIARCERLRCACVRCACVISLSAETSCCSTCGS